jgi:hypothetical protein
MFSFYRKKWKTRGSLAASRARKKPWNSIGLVRPRSPLRAKRQTAATTESILHIEMIDRGGAKDKWGATGE